LEIFDGLDQCIIQSKMKDLKDTGGILDKTMGILAYFKHTHSYKNPKGAPPFSRKQAKTTDVLIEATDKTLLGEIHEIPPPLFSMRLIRTFEIYNDKKELFAVVKEKPKFRGSDWILTTPEKEVIATTEGNWKKKDYKIKSQGKNVIARVYRDSSLNEDAYKIDILGLDVDLYLVLCYILVLDLAKTAWSTRSGVI
jgi:hypothetical protein